MNTQKNRTELRKRFLNVIEFMENKPIQIETFQGATVNGVFRSADYEFTNLHLHTLSTPIGSVPEALVRTSDVVTIKFSI
jgi:gem associated protein 7